ncbi:MAG: 2,3-bisphosphoglycerate-independent phosphoglycerate mutase [Candidatus Scalindua sp.]|jgi:2,3-bisphosphoglycerate-independent phosphoglycerate mutase|nr:2,3-bisphosphoglycerate-independent phosphoglycerate mutase [Candidatus Scalindua sp.]MBT6225600.1 2,3-bisphosphoglycerate-independent phosphoglycerate mutase [Candidatus Scalindua sp.]MBT6560953.1 2,3-bisphosphoglycerate-independent phosphoglycerate mutase [Candidatus Scalindua sp.]MBT7210574.1 2,3-bisphosphoglycerate-independent phosphoglycerate mutase [Candidatus Scalindua sp.]MBT7590823.1 2,3-bisphosphoglycerate-independent phosphoglycerate mutase [Candidatus Scalindua sp.]
MQKSIVLIIRDGWGINPNPDHNAIKNAHTPITDALLESYPNTILEASGTAVGLPDGYQGSSEVGHLNIGAGRIVEQEITKITNNIRDGSFFKSSIFQKAINNVLENSSSLHLMGLVQDEGVHAHQDHLFSIMKYAKEKGVARLYIHFFADGRDSAPKSALNYIRTLKEKIDEYGIGEIATFMGRYYAMDRGKEWRLTTTAYDAITKGEGKKIESEENLEDAIQEVYKTKTPNDKEMFDEYIPPMIIGDYEGVKDGDSVIHFNYRQDRAIQLTKAFVEDNYPGERWKKLDIVYCGLTRYYDTFPYNILEPMDDSGGMNNLLSQILSQKGLKQIRISETQKYSHVTSFVNGKRTEPFPGEEQIEIKGTFDPATFADHPEMNAYEVTDEAVKRINSNEFSLMIINLANCDMVGHTGNYEAAMKAVEVVDECVGILTEAILLKGKIALITADHGNADEMIDYKTGIPKTSHTKNPVEFIYIAKDHENIKLLERGTLSDIAPTILHLLDIEKPVEMTSNNLIILDKT